MNWCSFCVCVCVYNGYLFPLHELCLVSLWQTSKSKHLMPSFSHTPFVQVFVCVGLLAVVAGTQPWGPFHWRTHTHTFLHRDSLTVRATLLRLLCVYWLIVSSSAACLRFYFTFVLCVCVCMNRSVLKAHIVMQPLICVASMTCWSPVFLFWIF